MPVETELYEILNVSYTATKSEIKKAYYKLALVHHPDKGGDEAEFKKISYAYEILSNDAKRESYDNHGKEGLENKVHHHDDTFFRSMFSQMFGQMFQHSQRKTSDTIHTCHVTLEQLCQQKTLKFRLQRNILCVCTKINPPLQCTTCKGKGHQVKLTQIAFGMHVQQHVPCGNCNQTGKLFSGCSDCSKGIINNEKIFTLQLSPDIHNNQRIVYENEGNEHYGLERGNFVVNIVYKEHPEFKVYSNGYLHYTRHLSIKDILCGCTYELTHPSGEKIEVTVPQCYNPSENICIKNKGIRQTTNMIIEHVPIYPSVLNEEQINTLKQIL